MTPEKKITAPAAMIVLIFLAAFPARSQSPQTISFSTLNRVIIYLPDQTMYNT